MTQIRCHNCGETFPSVAERNTHEYEAAQCKGRPEFGKVYALTGAPGVPCIANGNTWGEAEVPAEVTQLPTAQPAPRHNAGVDRAEAITAIRTALKRRSGKTWTVKGDRGTAWGWITVEAPPARRVCMHKTHTAEELAEAYPNGYACGPACEGHRWYMSREDQAELGELMGMRVGPQGISIAASSEYRREYMDRAERGVAEHTATPYWD